MLKPPWGLNSPLTRPSEQESGADLQADVMRFMAILAFCLLAVFALVQSVPNSARDQAVTQTPGVTPEQPQVKPPVPSHSQSTDQSRRAAPIEIMQEEAKTTSRAPTTSDAQPSTHASAQPIRDTAGFALHFESDLALESLVAKGKVNLFGQVGKRIWLLSIKSGYPRFHLTTAPQQFHVMTPESVPARIATALRRDTAEAYPDRVVWGVTLPRATTEQIMRFLRKSSGGSLLIQADGQVRLQDTH